MRTALSFSPAQARAPKGTPLGGQWIDTPGDALEGLEAYTLFQLDRYGNTPPEFDPSNHDSYHVTADADSNKTQLMRDQGEAARGAYMNDKGHAKISEALRSGAISPPRGGATYGDAGYFDPHREDGAYFNRFTGEAEVLGDGSGAVHAIDGEMTENWFTQPTTLYRGLSVDPDASFAPGTRWQEKGYISTTYSPEMAEEFAKMRSGQSSIFDGMVELREESTEGKPMVFKVIVPKDAHFVPGASSVGELILDRGGYFEVLESTADMVTIKYEQFDDAAENKAPGPSDSLFEDYEMFSPEDMSDSISEAREIAAGDDMSLDDIRAYLEDSYG